jgi:hypothetical protein
VWNGSAAHPIVVPASENSNVWNGDSLAAMAAYAVKSRRAVPALSIGANKYRKGTDQS